MKKTDRFGMRIDPTLKNEAEAAAAKKGMKLSAYITQALVVQMATDEALERFKR